MQRMVEADRIETLQGYVRDVVARDVAERLGRENITLATQIALFAAQYGLRAVYQWSCGNVASGRLENLLG